MTTEFNPEAVKWIDHVNAAAATSAGWRLEVLGKRFRKPVKNQQGELEYPKSPLRIRRFVKGLPWALVHDAVRYLISQSPYEGIIYNGVKVPGKYRPTMTRWTRDDQERVDGQASGSYTLVQDLIEDGVTDEFHIPSGGSCSEDVVTEWRWDDPDVVDATTLEGFGQQGVTYSIQAVRRDDNGGFEYAIVKRVSKTQFSGWHVTECNEFERVETATWDNVYGGIGNARFDVGAGEPIPEPCDSSKGVTVTRQVTENPDCTFKITAQRRVALPEDGQGTLADESCAKDVFEHVHETETRSQHDRIGEAPTPGGGVSYTHSSSRQPDGTFANKVRCTTEEKNVTARKSRRKTLRGVVETTVTRGTSSSNVGVTDVGDEVIVEKTPGGLWTRTETKRTNTSVGQIGSDCQRDVFSHQHTTVRNQSTKPAEDDVTSAGDGVYHSRSARQTEEGTWDVTERTTTEVRAVSRKSKRKTLRGVVEVTETRNDTSDTVSVANVGDEVTVERTPGGRWNRTVKSIASSAVGTVATSCQQTIFNHEHSVTSNENNAPKSEAAVASGGVVSEVSARQTEEGTWDVTRKTVTEKAVPDSRVRVRRVLHGTYEDREDRHSLNAVQPQLGIGSEYQAEKNPGGTVTTNVTTFTPQSAGSVGNSGESSYFQTRTTTVTHAVSASSSSPSFTKGTIKSVESSRDSDGTWNTTTTTTKATTGVEFAKTAVKTIRGVETTEVRDNTANGFSSVDPKNIGEQQSVQYNEFGRTRHTTVKKTPATYRKWDAVAKLSHLYVKKVWFINANEDQYKALINSECKSLSDLCKKWVDNERPFSSSSADPEVHLTEWDLYDGSITLRVVWDSMSAGMGDTKAEGKTFLDAFASVSSPGGDFTYKTNMATGRGKEELQKYASKQPDAPCVSYRDDFSYNPSNGVWQWSRAQTVKNSKSSE